MLFLILTTLDDSELQMCLIKRRRSWLTRFSYGNVITSTSDFAAFWTTVAKEFASNEKVIFDTSKHVDLLGITMTVC